MTKRAYIAGPMRGYPHYNFPAFDSAVLELHAMDIHGISPADLDRLIYGWADHPPPGIEFTPEDTDNMLARDFAVIRELTPGTDFIYMLKGWEQSKGATAEYQYAIYRGLEVILQ